MKDFRHMTIVALAAVGLALAGCGGGGSSDTAQAPVTTPDPTPTPDPGPTDLETAQTAAMAAADAAKTASDNAAASAMSAADATMNLATMQTGAMSMSQADKAKMQADAAMAAYMAAKAASDAAAAATETAAAIRAQIDAEAAQADAEAAAMKAGEYGDMAMATAMGELMIDGTMKSVGETSIDANAPKSVVTSGSGASEQVTETGLIRTPMTTGATTNGRAEMDADITTDPPTPYKSPMVNAEEREDLKIGKVVDSADDMARLQIITAYASTKSVKVYDTSTDAHFGGKEGKVAVVTDGGAAVTAGTLRDEANTELTLRPVGLFYEVVEPATGGTDGTIDPLSLDTTTDPDNPAQAGDTVAADAEPKQVYSFVNTAVAGDDKPTVYVVLNETTARTDAEGETVTDYEYVVVDIDHQVNRDGIGETGAAGDEDVFVTAALPAPKSYSHIHFGAWASLGEAAKDGTQKIAGLGIGFVQSIGDGMTGDDMQNAGIATYNGNWTGTVQEAHPDGEGTIILTHGDASLSANFDKAEITADLTGLATLKGDISGNMFSGDAASDISAMHGLDSDATFTGDFSGGFYGTKNAEAGGIFAFTGGEGGEGGAFTGAFGGAKKAAN